MKSRFLGVGIGSSIFILLIITVLAVIRPVYVRLFDIAQKTEATLMHRLEESTGLSVSYSSLSPAIFASIRINKIEFHDAQNKNKILGIHKAVLSFNIAKLLSKNPVQAFETLHLNGVEVEYDAAKDSDIVEKIKLLAETLKNDGKKQDSHKKTPAEESQPHTFTLKGRTFDFPFDVVVNNFSVHYADAWNDVVLSLKKLELKDYFANEMMSVKTSGKFVFQTEKLKKSKGSASRAKIASSFSISGTIYQDIQGSSALVSFSGASGADYSISHLDMLLNFADDRIELRTMRTVLPFSIFAQADLNAQVLKFSGNFDRFDPFKLVSVRSKTAMQKKIAGSTISGMVSGQYGKSKVEYKSDLKISVSEKLAGSRIDSQIKLEGDKENIAISKIMAKSSFVDADFSGSFNIPKLQPSGVFSLNYFSLKNGGIVSTEVYVDPYKNGFMCFAPQLFMGDKSLTAIQLTVLPENNSLDFAFELYDYAHPEYEQSGRILVEGSYLLGRQKIVQAQVQMSNIFADSAFQTAAFFMNGKANESLNNFSKTFAPYIFTTEFYVSTDFKDVSCNAPYCLFANTKKDDELLMFSVDGSKQTFQLSQLDVQFGKQTAHAEASIDFLNGLKEFSFVSDMTVNSVPYHLSGNFSPEWIMLSGDYGFDAIISISDELRGNLQFVQLPFKAGKTILSSSINSAFSWNAEDGMTAQIFNFEIEQPSAAFNLSPHFALSGNASRYGFIIDEFSYADNSSSVSGDGSVLWNINNGIFDSAHVSVKGENPVSAERLKLNADFTNPNKMPFSTDALMNEFYMAVEASAVSFPVARLIGFQTAENTITADLTASGTLSNPFVSLMLHNASLSVGGYPLVAHAEFVMDDVGMNLNNLDFTWRTVHLSDGQFSFDPLNFVGDANAFVETSVFGKSIKMPLEARLSGESTGKKFSVPEFYNAEIKTPGITGEFIKKDIPYQISIVRTPGQFDFFSDDDERIRATYSDSGELFIYSGIKNFVQFAASGIVKNHTIDLSIDGIHSNVKDISSGIDFPIIVFTAGRLTGNMKISGSTADPEISGALCLDENPSCNIPALSKYNIHTDRLDAKIEQNELVIPKSLLYLGKAAAYADVEMEISRGKFTFLNANLKSTGRRGLPFDMTFPIIHAKGNGFVDFNFQLNFPRQLYLTGDLEAENSEVEIVITSLQKQFSANTFKFFYKEESKSEAPIDVVADLNMKFNQKVQCMFNPLIRGVVTPGSQISFYIDSLSGDYDLKGEIPLRGGEIAWLNRNFYMKEGKVILNESDDKAFDPRLTVLAETRERDDSGNLVTISLNARNQFLSMFNPIFTATPMKSEKEIMQLLGQIVVSDSDNLATLAVAGGDYLVQTTVMRRIENTLRELMNFDIFSIRTNVLQNSVKLRMNRNSHGKQAAIGNFIDNSTVYVGKYFGSSLYVDTLLHWSYDDAKDKDDKNSVNGIVFQPEFGLEMVSPYVNIRLGVAPNIESIQRGFQGTIVPSTFMTLSWKHAF